MEQMQKKLEQLENELMDLKKQMSAAAQHTKPAVAEPKIVQKWEKRAVLRVAVAYPVNRAAAIRSTVCGVPSSESLNL